MSYILLTNIFVNNGATDNFEEVGIQLTCHGSGKKSLACTGRSIQQTSLGRDDTNSHEQLGIEKRKLNDLSQLSDLLAKTSDIRVGHISWVLMAHVVHKRINFSGQIPDIGKCWYYEAFSS